MGFGLGFFWGEGFSEGGFEMGMIFGAWGLMMMTKKKKTFGAWGMRERMTDGTTQNFGAGSLGAWGVGER